MQSREAELKSRFDSCRKELEALEHSKLGRNSERNMLTQRIHDLTKDIEQTVEAVDVARRDTTILSRVPVVQIHLSPRLARVSPSIDSSGQCTALRHGVAPNGQQKRTFQKCSEPISGLQEHPRQMNKLLSMEYFRTIKESRLDHLTMDTNVSSNYQCYLPTG